MKRCNQLGLMLRCSLNWSFLQERTIARAPTRPKVVARPSLRRVKPSRPSRSSKILVSEDTRLLHVVGHSR